MSDGEPENLDAENEEETFDDGDQEAQDNQDNVEESETVAPTDDVPDIKVEGEPTGTPIEGEDGEENREEGEDGEPKEEDHSEGHMSRIEEEVEVLRHELSDIAPAGNEIQYETMPTEFNPDDFHYRYRENTSKEFLVLNYAENFRRQYVHLYRDRKPLFLCPFNECNVEKFVCSTIRPTKSPHREMYNWEGAAEFVADYLNFVPLTSPTELPSCLLSPQTALKIQKGTCFEYATILCCFLLGVGYDAYVVSGYATRETCFMDESREDCPLLIQKEVAKAGEEKKTARKYTVKPPKDLGSKFQKNMEERGLREEAEANAKARKEAIEKEIEGNKPPSDSLHGLRIHAWVLVLSGKREVPESFFIEPLTGLAHSVSSENYLGIESLWNHQNYWVNMQDCSKGVSCLSYDLGDCTLWEYMFPGNDKPILTIPDDNFEDEEEPAEEIEKHLELPPSWTEPIDLSRKDFEMRCPLGKKIKLYKRAKLEKFAPYLLRDGMVTKLSIYSDRELTDLLEIREYFSARADHLEKRVINSVTGWVTEYFSRGRSDRLKDHTYQQSEPGPETNRVMTFYNDARFDGLSKREENPNEMTDHFLKRGDFLYYRHVEFGRRVKKFGPAGESSNVRPIEKITVRYHRNPSIPASDDVAERLFAIIEDRIHLTYHRLVSNIAANTREYIKPAQSDDKSTVIVMQSDTHTTFQVNPYSKQKKEVEIYELLLKLLVLEDKEKEAVRLSETESRNILEERANEEAISTLDIGLFDTLRNEKAKKHRRDLEQRLADEKLRRQETELDYLAPFLAKKGITGKLTRTIAFELRNDCLKDFKQRLVDKANLIQARFERETTCLQKKQQWYQQNQISMSKEDEAEYLQYCHDAAFRITTLELMLSRHKQTAPHKYMELEKKIRSDSRLAEFLVSN